MLIEAICIVKTSLLPPVPIASLSLKPLTHPIYEDEHVVGTASKIAIFFDCIICFTTHPAASRVFTIIQNSVYSSESIFPCTAIHYSDDHLLFIFSTDLEKSEILTRLSTHTDEKENNHCRYIINGVDGCVTASFSQLKRGIYLNKNTLVSSVHPCADFSTYPDKESPMASIYTDKQRQLTSICKDLAQLSISTPIFYSNKPEYTSLIKTFLNENDVLISQNAIKHCIIQNIDTFYFIFFNIGGHLTVFLTRKLYNYVPLYNYIQSVVNDFPINNSDSNSFYNNRNASKHNIYDSILSIPDLNGLENGRSFDIICCQPFFPKYTIQLHKFIVRDYNAMNQISLILKYSSVVLEETRDSFWFIVWFKQLIYPFLFPGLIICPVILSTTYLLDGPFPFLVASRLIHGKGLLCPTPQPGTLGSCKGRVNSILNNKNAYMKRLLHSKRAIEKLPHTFSSSFLIEQYFLNEPKRHTVDYSIDISTGEILFTRGAYLNVSDAVSLWLMLYRGKVSFKSLISKRWINLEYLCRRACIEKNISVVKSIIKICGKSQYQRRWRLKAKMWRAKRRKEFSSFLFTSETDILRAVGNQAMIDFGQKLDLSGDVKIRKSSRFSTMIEYEERVYRLIRVDDILQCLDAGYESAHIRGCIIAYLKYADLPINIPESENVTDDDKNPMIYC